MGSVKSKENFVPPQSANTFISSCGYCNLSATIVEGSSCPFEMQCVSRIYTCNNESCPRVKWHNHPMEESCSDILYDQIYWCLKCNKTCSSNGHKIC